MTSGDYQNITTDASTIFAGNTANAAYTPPSIVYDYTNIGYSTSSLMKSATEYLHPINNYDINYAREEPYEPPVNPEPPSPEVTEQPTELPDDGIPLAPPTEETSVPDTVIPKTGDSSPLIWLALLVISILGILLLTHRRKSN